MAYVTWEYFSSLYPNYDSDEFYGMLTRASSKIDAITHNRVKQFESKYLPDTATEFEMFVHQQIMTTVCELINTMQIQDSSCAGNGIASVSNDGYSESYKITTVAEKEAQLISVIRNGLSGTGLAGAL